MANESKDKVTKDDFKKLKEEINKKKGTDQQQIIQQIATRTLLERDYQEDVLEVVFYTSPQTQRKLQARRPTQKQMIMIMKLSAEAALYETKFDEKSISKMTDIYSQLNSLAAELALDKKLDKEFWSTKVSFATLQNFITELIKETQKGTGVSPDEMKSFRWVRDRPVRI